MRYLMLLQGTQPAEPPPPGLMDAIMALGAEATAAGALLDTAGLMPAAAGGAEVSLTGGHLSTVDAPFAVVLRRVPPGGGCGRRLQQPLQCGAVGRVRHQVRRRRSHPLDRLLARAALGERRADLGVEVAVGALAAVRADHPHLAVGLLRQERSDPRQQQPPGEVAGRAEDDERRRPVRDGDVGGGG